MLLVICEARSGTCPVQPKRAKTEAWRVSQCVPLIVNISATDRACKLKPIPTIGSHQTGFLEGLRALV